jgi:hypothetical protein
MSEYKWTKVKIAEPLRKKLIRAILKGEIDRAEYPELWPKDHTLIEVNVTWPPGD